MLRTSVLINNFNNGPYLREGVESVLAQTQPANEVIAYDDGSTDDSLAILRSFGSRIILIEGQRSARPSRAAQANAIYEAFCRSTGELIFLLDGDDRFHPDKIAVYSQAFLDAPDSSLIQSPLEQIDAAGLPLGDNYQPLKHQEDYLRATYRMNDADFYYPTSSLALSRSFLKEVLPLDFSDLIELSADTRLGMFAPLFGRVISLTKPFSDWRRHPLAFTAKKYARTEQIRQTFKRYRVFNHFARARHLRPISLWRNRRFYLQLLRAGTPDFLYSLYYRRFYPAAPTPAKSTPNP
jgi:glycosyltransferase involved in cell wall biosynthesis